MAGAGASCERSLVCGLGGPGGSCGGAGTAGSCDGASSAGGVAVLCWAITPLAEKIMIKSVVFQARILHLIIQCAVSCLPAQRKDRQETGVALEPGEKRSEPKEHGRSVRGWNWERSRKTGKVHEFARFRQTANSVVMTLRLSPSFILAFQNRTRYPLKPARCFADCCRHS